MKFEQIDSFKGDDSTGRYTSFLYVDHTSQRGHLLYVGTELGPIYCFTISKTVPQNRQDELNPTPNMGNHGSSVLCLLPSRNRLLYSNLTGSIADDGGFLFSGNSDRTIKVWRSSGSQRPLIQTLHGHSSQVSALCDGCDGTIISCSVDGSLRVWAPQQVIFES